MTFKADPHLLVAIMRQEYSGRQDTFPRRSNRETSVRTFPVLDAIASISVYKAEHQVFAAALQLDPVNREIRLVIAENKGTKDKLVQHLMGIWEKLRILSNEYAKSRGLDLWMEEGSPKVPAEVALPLRVEIFRDIYKFSLRKHMHRVEKWKDGFVLFMREFANRREGVELEGFELNLWDAASEIFLLLGSLGKIRVPKETDGGSEEKLEDGECEEEPMDSECEEESTESECEEEITDSEWEVMFLHSISISDNVRLALAESNGVECEDLAHEITGHYSKGPFELRRALEKLTSLSRQIDSLLSFARSPRLRPALEYTMSVCAVPKRTRTVPLPGSELQWLSFIKSVCRQKRSWQPKKAGVLLKRFSPPERVCEVHCECSLIEYLGMKDGSLWDNVPPLSYIGVSKLSCAACHLWIEASNEQGKRIFYTKGSHGKWCWPWGMPEAEERIERAMIEKVTHKYLSHLRENRLLRSGSDSTDPASVGARLYCSVAQKNTVKTIIAASLQEARGTRTGFMKAVVSKYSDRQGDGETRRMANRGS